MECCTKKIKLLTFLLVALSCFNLTRATWQPSSYRLIGSSHSFAQYLPWYPCLNGTIIFEFKTHEPHGLLFYAQSLPYKYIQVSLADGLVRLRMRISETDNPRGVILIFQLFRVNDEKWHEIRITRSIERTIFTVDGNSLNHVHAEASLEGHDLYFGNIAQSPNPNNDLLVIGGFPNSLQTYDLSLGTALFETRFNGFIRNVKALNCTYAYLARLEVVSSSNLKYIGDSDACSTNPCRNNGTCSLNDDELKFRCDCSFTSYQGSLCEKLRPSLESSEFTFGGKDYFSFEMPSDSSFTTTYEEEFHIGFKTSRSTGLLVYAGDGQDYFVFGLQDGNLYFKINIKGQAFEKMLNIAGSYLHDNNWHSVKFSRKIKQIEIAIDNLKRDESSLTGEFIAMQTRIIYVGGAPQDHTIYRSIRKNFIGCLKNVTYKTDTVSMNLIDLALNESSFIKRVGNLQTTTCQQVMTPVTFSSPSSYIPILQWKDDPDLLSFSIDFQTNERYGVLAYILGAQNPNNNNNPNSFNKLTHQIQSKLLSFNRDFFSLEIHDRFLNAYFNLGSSYIRYEVINEPVSSDGKSHQITVEINNKYATFKFDQQAEKTIRIDTAHSDDKLDLFAPLVIGGIYPNHTNFGNSDSSVKIPPYFYSGMLGHGFVGCIQDVEINGQMINLTHYADMEKVSGVSSEMCTPMANQCDIGHCMNEGVCMEGWNRFVCDCVSTGFNGPICNQPATVAHFKKGDKLRFMFDPEWISEAEHLSLRFRTSQKDNSILLSTYSVLTKDLMEISLENTQIRLYLKIGSAETTMYSNEGLCDNKWHTIKILREGSKLILQVDNDEPATGMLTGLSLLNEMQIHFTYLEIGSASYKQKELYYMNLVNNYKSLSYLNMDLGSKYSLHRRRHKRASQTTSFEGQMQSLILNGKSYFELMENGDLLNLINHTITFSKPDISHKYPLSFHTSESWFALPRIDAYHMLLIQFHFKTDSENGLILYNGGQNDDYVAVELVNGQILYAFSLGKSINTIKSKSKIKLNDNEWHLVSIWRSTKSDHELTVDSLVYKYSSDKNKYTMFNLDDKLYIGSLPSQGHFNKLNSNLKIISNKGFKGCLASIEINGRMPAYDDVVGLSVSGNISKGCENPNDCDPKACRNGGICEQKWLDNTLRNCNCDSSSFSGKHCDQMSRGYNFQQGMITYEFKNPLYWQADMLVFGLETNLNNTFLFRAFSPRNTRTIVVEVLDGYIQAAFNDMHGINHLQSFRHHKVNDNKYHIVRFRIHDFNSSLTVDNLYAQKQIIQDKSQNPLRKYRPLPSQNDPTLITVETGATKEILKSEFSWPASSNLKIYGLVFNQFRILDLAALNAPGTEILGKLTLLENVDYDSFFSCSDSFSDKYNSYLCNTANNQQKTTNIVSPLEPIIKQQTDDKMSTESTAKPANEPPISLTNPSLVLTTSVTNSILNLSTGYIIVIAVGSIFVLLVLIFALYKYRNRDEGTYTIDEAKNYGPFAELDMPLNGSKSKKAMKNRRKGLQEKNKEWYV